MENEQKEQTENISIPKMDKMYPDDTIYDKGGNINKPLSYYEVDGTNKQRAIKAGKILDWVFNQDWFDSEGNEKPELRAEYDKLVNEFEKEFKLKVNRSEFAKGGSVKSDEIGVGDYVALTRVTEDWKNSAFYTTGKVIKIDKKGIVYVELLASKEIVNLPLKSWEKITPQQAYIYLEIINGQQMELYMDREDLPDTNQNKMQYIKRIKETDDAMRNFEGYAKGGSIPKTKIQTKHEKVICAEVPEEIKKEFQLIKQHTQDFTVNTEKWEENYNHLYDILVKHYPKAIKQEVKDLSKKESLKAKITAFKIALKFSKGTKKSILNKKIKAFETALKFIK